MQKMPSPDAESLAMSREDNFCSGAERLAMSREDKPECAERLAMSREDKPKYCVHTFDWLLDRAFKPTAHLETIVFELDTFTPFFDAERECIPSPVTPDSSAVQP